ncbi:hypothetical protein FRC12_008492 [Ceratobasidium sp. 428]|nr:hypothetical protein FRC12_008492 [Ceratobasidium sp. 428]
MQNAVHVIAGDKNTFHSYPPRGNLPRQNTAPVARASLINKPRMSESAIQPHDPTSNANVFSLSERIKPAVISALAEWKSARSLMTSTIHSYLSTSATLRAACANSASQPAERFATEEALVAIDSELESLALEEDILRDGRALLAATRNYSTRLAPVNALPSEILARIFAFSKTYNYCIDDGYLRPDSFTSVCVYWRQVALAATHLWTHIDMGPTTPDGLTELLLDRSKDTPIHVHVIESQEISDTGDPYAYTCECIAQGVMSQLESDIYRLRTLEIRSDTVDGEIIPAILDAWSTLDDVGAPASLSVERPYSKRTLVVPAQGETSDNLEKLLLAFTSLHMDSVHFDWASNAYHGLIDLRLSFYRYVHISTPQLFDILSSCPGLHTLKLRNLIVNHVEDWAKPNPITMGHLKALNFIDIKVESASSVLSLIALPEFFTELSIGITPSSTIDNQLTDFFARSKLATLYCYDSSTHSSHDWVYLLFQHRPRFRKLILDGFYLFNLPETQLSTPFSLSELQTTLCSIIFLGCRLDFESLKNLVVSFGIQDLRFESRPQYGVRRDLEDIRTSILEVYPELRCSVSNTDSTAKHAFRVMFE